MPRELLPPGANDIGKISTSPHNDRITGEARRGQGDLIAQLHVYPQILGLQDIESCIQVENAAFPPQERCSREKFKYRINACGELNLGLFSSASDEQYISSSSTAITVDSQDPVRKATLLAHIIVTKSTGRTVTDEDMALPDTSKPETKVGHKEHGRTVCIHSLAVLPAYQRKGLGTILLKEYITRLRSSGVADRIAIIAHDHLIKYYERFGFELLGPSQAQFGGGGWYDMSLTL